MQELPCLACGPQAFRVHDGSDSNIRQHGVWATSRRTLECKGQDCSLHFPGDIVVQEMLYMYVITLWVPGLFAALLSTDGDVVKAGCSLCSTRSCACICEL